MPIIATSLCFDEVGEESEYPQVGGESSSCAFQAVYWKCCAVFFASSVRHNPSARHILFTNAEAVLIRDGVSVENLLQKLGVEIVRLPFRYAPPRGYYGRWRSTFYLFDILKYLSAQAGDGDRVIICDTDCVFVKPADGLVAAIDRYGLLTYDCKLTPDEDINGLSRRELGALHEELSGTEGAEPPAHYGAEIFAASATAIKSVVREIDPLWTENISRFRQGLAHFNTEEHYLSYIYARLGILAGTANPFIDRIWTGLRYRTARPEDFDLAIWHVPAEKKHGLSRLYEEACRPNSRFWRVEPGSEFAAFAAKYLGIPKSSALKRCRDIFDIASERLKRQEGRRVAGAKSQSPDVRVAEGLPKP